MSKNDQSGFYLDECSGYIIEENYFAGSLFNSGVRGLTINNSYDQPNFIYRNTFVNMKHAVIAQNMNSSRDGSKGLQIKCNTFDGNIMYDISVLYDNKVYPEGIPAVNGIPNQGSDGDGTKPAGNIFSHYSGIPGCYSILNECHSIEYFHHDPTGNDKVVPGNTTNVTPKQTLQDWVPNTCCPASTTGGGTSIIDSETENYKILSDSITNALNLLIDDGSTLEKVFMVNSAAPDESLIVHDDLLQTSPFTSDTVLISSIEREELLNNTMIRDIMVANPHSAKSEEVMQKLESRITPMPDNLLDEIMEGINTLSAKELMEISSNLNYSLYSYGLNRLLSQTLNDTMIVSNDSVVSLLHLDGSANSLMRVAWFMLQNGDTIGAINKVDSVFAGNLTEYESNELNKQKALMLWLIDNPVIDSTSVEDLNIFLQSGSQLVSFYSRSILITNDLLVYNEPYLDPRLNKNQAVSKAKKVSDAESFIKIYPNPAKDYITVNYNSRVVNANSEIIIIDNAGKIVNTISLSKNSDQFIVNTQKLRSGTYLIKLIINNKIAAKEKFIIVK